MARAGITSHRATDKDHMWRQWQTFVATIPGVDQYLNQVPPHLHLSFLKVFATRVRRGALTSSGQPVRAKRVQDYLRTVAEEIRLGSQHRLDPRFNAQNLREKELQDLAKGYTKADPPPDKVKPIPITLVQHSCSHADSSSQGQAIANMLVIGFFFLLRPGEYTYDAKNNHPFRLQDITFETPTGFHNAAAAPTTDLQHATKVLLYFTTQKNGVQGQAITHGDTANPVLSPVQAVLRQVLHLRRHRAPPTTPLHTYFVQGKPHSITARLLTNTLKSSCKAIGSQFGIAARDISVRALRNGGCMALIRANIDSSQVRLMGRWKSWAMLEYLCQQAVDTSQYASRMLSAGDFVIPAHQLLPADVLSQAQPYLE